jgi:membrane-associated phospholipid phosphatase
MLAFDFLMIAYVSLVCIAIVFRHAAIPHPWLELALYSGIGLATLVLVRWARRLSEKAAILSRAVFACASIPVLFLSLGGLVPYVNPYRGERHLRAIDDFLFLGRNPNEMLDGIAFPLLTEYLQFIYATYYFLPLVLLAGLIIRRKIAALPACMTAIVLSLFLSYIGYFLVPATSPSVNIEGLYPWPPYEEELRTGVSTLPGIAFADTIREALYRAEAIQHDCFPSGHTAMALVVLLLARRHHRGFYRILLVPVVSLVFSTVYLRYHYVIDVIVGIGLSAITLAGADWLERRFQACPRSAVEGISLRRVHHGGTEDTEDGTEKDGRRTIG